MGLISVAEARLHSPEVGEVTNQKIDYDVLVAKQMKALRERSGLTLKAMAQAISDETGRTIYFSAVSRWERQHQEPLASMLLAAMRVAGLALPSEAPKDPKRTLARELEELRRQVDIVASRVNHTDDKPILPAGYRVAGRYVNVAEAAKRLRLSREGVYQRIRRSELRAFTWMGRTVILTEDLDSP